MVHIESYFGFIFPRLSIYLYDIIENIDIGTLLAFQ